MKRYGADQNWAEQEKNRIDVEWTRDALIGKGVEVEMNRRQSKWKRKEKTRWEAEAI